MNAGMRFATRFRPLLLVAKAAKHCNSHSRQK